MVNVNSKKWSKVDKALAFFKQKEAQSQLFTIDEMAHEIGWTSRTIETYFSKKYQSYIKKHDKNFWSCHGFQQLSVQEFHELHTQTLTYTEIPVLIKKAQQFAILAVANFNNPMLEFKTYSFIVNLIIAWTALFHAIFEKRDEDYFYWDKKSNDYKKVDGEKCAWDISQCIIGYWKGDNTPEKANLQLLVGLRNKIEHRDLPMLDAMIAGRCQSALTNFEDMLVKEFGERYSLNLDLAVSLQLSSSSNETRAKALKAYHTKNYQIVRNYLDTFDARVSEDVLSSQRYQVRLFLIPKLNNHRGSADMILEYVHLDPANSQHRDQLQQIVAIKEKMVQPTYHKPKHVVEKVSQAIGKLFKTHHHTKAWKLYKVRASGKNSQHKNNQYCHWNAAYEDYDYTDSWINFLIKKLSNEEEYQKLLAFKP